jgi:hypothetical protein
MTPWQFFVDVVSWGAAVIGAVLVLMLLLVFAAVLFDD